MSIHDRSTPGRIAHISKGTLSTMSRVNSKWGNNKAKTDERISKDIKEIKRKTR